MRNILSKVFAEELFFVRPWRTKTRKNACFARFFMNAYNGLKRMQKKFKTILSNFKFYARINARTYAYAHFCAHLLIWNWPDKYWPWSWQIWMRNGFLLWRYDHKFIFRKFHKMAPRWRHQSRSRLKTLLCFVHMPIHMCAKYQSIWLNHFKVILLTKKWVEIRKINK